MTLALLTLGVGGPLWAQGPGEIHGKVKDSSGAAVLFGIVRAQQGGVVHGVETDGDGRFVLKPLPSGAYTVIVQATGYKSDTIIGVRVDPGLIVTLPDAVLNSELDPVVVTAKRGEEPLIRPDDPSRIVMTTAQIKTNATRKDPVRMIAAMTPGVTRSANSDELYFRGSRSGSMAYYVDGVKVTGTDPGIPPEAINRVSVYTGGLPACYGDVTGGVVSIETKSYFDLYEQRNAANR
jgi:hypothetical protein